MDKAVSGSNVTTTIANGGVGSSDTTYADNTNFGFNAIGGTIGDKSYNEALTGTTYFDDLEVYLKNACEFCKFDIIGYASEQGGGDNAANQNLAKKRGENLKDWLKSKYGLADNRFKKVQGKVITNAGCPDGVSVDSAGCKEVRQARADLVYDSSLEIADTGRVTVFDANEPAPRTIIPISRFYSECDYFEAIDKETDSFVYSDLKSKLKNFHPAFHAITPEGFNSRLTFLQQCMRQGPTTNANNPDNLAFGRPPVCILRIGDFYHTKIIIESLTIDYDPLVWDLNPEGVGVQPMIANINISFAFIGGSSMKGPINRLQNAISFNFFANTELYDPRAERIKLEEKPRKNGNYIGDIVEGKFPFPPNTLELFQNQDGIPGKNDKVTSQEAEAEAEDTIPANTEQGNEIKDEDIFLQFPNTPFLRVEWDNGVITARYGNLHPARESQSKPYEAKLQIWTSTGNVDVATATIGGPESENIGRADFTSESVFDSNTMSLAAGRTSSGSKTVGSIVFTVIIPELNIRVAIKSFGWLEFDCPGYFSDRNTLIDQGDADNINEDPCCECYPDPYTTKSGKPYILGGETCPLSGTTC